LTMPFAKAENLGKAKCLSEEEATDLKFYKVGCDKCKNDLKAYKLMYERCQEYYMPTEEPEQEIGHWIIGMALTFAVGLIIGASK
jgi:hypothetical protein